MGLLEATLDRLRAELGDEIRVLSEDVFRHDRAVLRGHLERLRIESVPALIPIRRHAGMGRLGWAARLAGAFVGVMAVRIAGRRALGFIPRNVAAAIEAMLDADVVLSKAGGHLYATAGRRIGSASYLFTIWSAIALRRPTVIYAQSIGPFNGRLADWIARMAIRHVAFATAREARTYRWLASVLPSGRVRLTGDEAFLLPVAGPSEARSMELGMTAVTWRFPGHPAPDRARQEYEEALVQVARWYVDEYGGRVSFVRWLIGDHPEDDSRLIDSLIERIDRPGFVEAIGPFAPSVAAQRLGEMEMLVATRLHSAIFGMVVGTPAVAIEYLPKTSEVMAMATGRFWSIGIDEVGGGRLLEKARRLSKDLGQVQAELARRLPMLQNGSAGNARLVGRLLAGLPPDPE